MLQRIREAKKNESGFTLIELLIVIVILGILAAVVVFSVAGVNDQGQSSACKSDVATVTTAGEAYLAQNPTHTPAATLDVLSTSGFLHVPVDTTAGSTWEALLTNVTYNTVAAVGGANPSPATFSAVGAAGSPCAGYVD